MAQPLQIISTGDSDQDFFVLNQENLSNIISKIPADAKVSIVSVVGAFRTGKSFLLNFFLRYLRSDSKDPTSAWMVSEGEELVEGNMNEGWSMVHPSEAAAASSSSRDESEGGQGGGSGVQGAGCEEHEVDKQHASFAWRGGKERQTTGIWMWSEPFIRTSGSGGKGVQGGGGGGEKLAVLLMDTQGMFDNETTMTLTAQIFGLSTLVSSFQIYNVDKRIQEDNLQHLALFSEYGRMALLPRQHRSMQAAQEAMVEKAKKLALDGSSSSSAAVAAASDPDALPPPPPEAATGDDDDGGADAAVKPPAPPSCEEEDEGGEEVAVGAAAGAGAGAAPKPFQRLQFLVRDWQNFDAEYEELPASAYPTPTPTTAVTATAEAATTVDEEPVSAAVQENEEQFSALHAEMQSYLSEVLRSRGLGDLQSTREQITRCFDTLDCFMLPHPGFAVTRKNYDGSIAKIEPFFRALVNRYVRLVFDQQLCAKQINGRALSGRELQTYFEVYVKMFQAGQSSFPKAMTMLDATAEANNRNAFDLALDEYKRGMEQLVGEGKAYCKEDDLQQRHDTQYIAAFQLFDDMATMGAATVIDRVRTQLKGTVEKERARYFHTNSLRNPFKDAELYVVPLLIAAGAWFAAVIVNATCSTDFCENTEDTFQNIYLFIFFACVVMAWRHIQGSFAYVKTMLPLIMDGASAKLKQN